MGTCIYNEDGNCTSNTDYIGELEKENRLVKEIVSTQKEYIELLIEELNETIPIAHSHGWETTRFEKGKKFRSKILELGKMLKESEGEG